MVFSNNLESPVSEGGQGKDESGVSRKQGRLEWLSDEMRVNQGTVECRLMGSSEGYLMIQVDGQ